MFFSLFIIAVYLSFLIDFLIIPIPSEGSTGSRIKSTQSKAREKSGLVFIFVLNLAIYLYPLFFAAYHWVIGIEISPHQPTFHWSIYVGIFLTLVGRGLTIFGGAVLRKQLGSVVSSSIFRWSRNPIALGMHLTLLGLIIYTNQWFLLIGLAFSIWNIHTKIKIEEQHLIQKFGIRYTNYMNKTPRYLWI